jgi:hypothetical protein
MPTAPLARIGLRVDSVNSAHYEFASSAVTTRSDGAFELLVWRLDPVNVSRHVDSATFAIKGYLSDGDPSPRQPEDLRAWVTVPMSPVGEPVARSEGVFVFTDPASTPQDNPTPGWRAASRRSK